MQSISDNLNLNISKQLQTLLQNKLILDGFIEYLNPKLPIVFRITPEGIEFMHNGGYKVSYKRERNRKWFTIIWKMCLAIGGITGFVLAVIQIFNLCNCK